MYNIDLHLSPHKGEVTIADESTAADDEITDDGLTDDGLTADSESKDGYALASTSESNAVDNQDDCTWEYNFSEDDFHPVTKQATKVESSVAKAKRLAAAERQRLYHQKWRARMSPEQVKRFQEYTRDAMRNREYQQRRRRENPGIDKKLYDALPEEKKAERRERRA
ncbi:hypothetical protein BO83DRAFT_279943, partial [Aspergillus eucalypticola CBS 122712]